MPPSSPTQQHSQRTPTNGDGPLIPTTSLHKSRIRLNSPTSLLCFAPFAHPNLLARPALSMHVRITASTASNRSRKYATSVTGYGFLSAAGSHRGGKPCKLAIRIVQDPIHTTIAYRQRHHRSNQIVGGKQEVLYSPDVYLLGVSNARDPNIGRLFLLWNSKISSPI